MDGHPSAQAPDRTPPTGRLTITIDCRPSQTLCKTDAMQARVRSLEADDISDVKTILETWMRDEVGGPVRTHNVEQAIVRMMASAESSDKSYVVVEDDQGSVVGVGGFTTVGIDDTLAARFKRPAELVNVYVAADERGRGYGTILVDELERRIRQLGCSHLIVVSGSRNREHGYPFWDRRYGNRYQTDDNFFGPGAERVVWVEELKDNEGVRRRSPKLTPNNGSAARQGRT